MNSTEAEVFYRAVGPIVVKKLAVGWLAESAGALGAAAVAVLGLAGILSSSLAAAAALALGTALLAEGVALAFCFSRRTVALPEEGRTLEWGGAIAGKFLGGTAGVVIGCLVLVGAATPALVAIAVLVLGAVFVFTSMVSVVPGLQEIAGACSFILGALALMGLHPLTLVLTALLLLSLMALFNGAASERSLVAFPDNSPRP